MSSDFAKRLKKIIGPRRVTPWATSIGLSKGVIGTIQAENIPKADSLQLIAINEGASIHWLITGKSEPFIVNVDSPESTQHRINCLGDTDKIDVIVNDNKFILLHHYIDEETKLPTLDIAQPKMNSSRVTALKSINQTKFYYLPDDQFKEVWSGQIGRFNLYGDDKNPGLLVNTLPYDQITASESSSTVVDFKALRAVMVVIDSIIEDTHLNIGNEQKSNLISAGYNQLKRLEISPKNLTKDDLAVLFEMIE